MKQGKGKNWICEKKNITSFDHSILERSNKPLKLYWISCLLKKWFLISQVSLSFFWTLSLIVFTYIGILRRKALGTSRVLISPPPMGPPLGFVMLKNPELSFGLLKFGFCFFLRLSFVGLIGNEATEEEVVQWEQLVSEYLQLAEQWLEFQRKLFIIFMERLLVKPTKE